MKNWWASKTIILNSITLVAALLTTAAGSTLVTEHPQVAAGIASALAAINIGLRFLTITGIK